MLVPKSNKFDPSVSVSLAWVLCQLAGDRYPESGQAYDFIKSSFQAGLDQDRPSKKSRSITFKGGRPKPPPFEGGGKRPKAPPFER